VGKYQEAKKLFDAYREFANTHTSIYKHLSLAVCAVQEGDKERAFKELKLFAEEDQYSLWVIMFLEDDPLLDEINKTKEFRQFMDILKDKFNKRHEKLKKILKEERLI
jgi:hypothetical protein